MEEDDDVMASHSVIQQPVQTEQSQELLIQRDAVESTGIVSPEVVVTPDIAGGGEIPARELEVEKTEELKFETEIGGEDVEESNVVVDVGEELVVKGEGIEMISDAKLGEGRAEQVVVAVSEVGEGIEIVSGENVEKLRGESDELMAVSVGEGIEAIDGLNNVEIVEKSKGESDELVAVSGGERIEAVDGINEVENVDKSGGESDELMAVSGGEGIEAVDGINEVENVEKLRGESDELMAVRGGEEIEGVDGETKVESGEKSREGSDEQMVETVVNNVPGESVQVAVEMDVSNVEKEEIMAVTEEVEVKNEVVVEKDVEMDEEDVLSNVKEVEADEDVMAEQVPLVDENVGEKAEGDEAKKGEGDWISEAEDVPPSNEDVKTDEMVEDKSEGDEQQKEVKVKEEEQEENETEGKEEDEAEGMDKSPKVTKNDELMVEEGTPMTENDMETEGNTAKSVSGSGEKGKRARNAKSSTPVKTTPSRRVVGEDVCFICLDGGDLVLCDRRGCPKAYHPSCVDHDEEFFKTKGRWVCGWHQCNQCGKNAYFSCYTCQFSLCKACSKDATIFCVRGNKGFCESCMKTISLIENSEQNAMGQDAFNDKSSWEFLFKDYWLEQKEKLCITSEELSQAQNPLKDSEKQQRSAEVHEGNNDAESDSDSALGNSAELSDLKRKKPKRNSKAVDDGSSSSAEKNTSSGKRKSKRNSKSQGKEVNSDSEHSSADTSTRRSRKSRRLVKSRSKDVDDGEEDNIEWASKELLEFVMLMNKGNQSVLTQFEVQRLLLDYIKKKKLRDPRRGSQIICDSMLRKLFGKPRVAHFEMLKLLEAHFLLKDDDDNQGTNTDMRQLDADDFDFMLDGAKSRGRKSRKREEKGLQSNLADYAAIDMHNINLLFLRRNLIEALLDNPDTFHDKAVGAFVRIRISGNSKKEDMYRLVQIIDTKKVANTYKVGKRTTDIMLEILNLNKKETISMDTMSNQEFSEDECKRLRQSIKCGLIDRMTVGDILEKARELQEVRVAEWLEAEVVRLSHLRDRASEKGRKKELRECVEKLQLLKTPEERQRRLEENLKVHADPKMDPSFESEDEMDTRKPESHSRVRETEFTRRGRDNFSPRAVGPASNDSWSANARPPNQKWEPNRNSFGRSFSGRNEESVFASPTRERPWSNGVDKGTPRFNSNEKPGITVQPSIRAEHSGLRPEISNAAVVTESPRIASVTGQIGSKLNETEKTWHYRDPAGKIQGPFSMTQLRKWSNTGYFPTELRVWRVSQSENASIILTDILSGKAVSSVNNVPSPIDISNLSANARSFGTVGRYESQSNIPSPTPARSSFQSPNQSRLVERLPSPTPTPMPPSVPIVRRKSKWDDAGNNGGSIASSAVQQTGVQHSFPTSGPRPNVSSNLGMTNGQQIVSQPTVQMGGSTFAAPNPMMNQSNVAPGQNPSVYTHGWTPNNPNGMPSQVSYGQWPPAPFYGAGYTGPGNVAPNLASVPSQNAWGPAPTGMPWAGQQPQLVNPNMVWTGPPTGATAMVQQAGSMPGVIPPMGWSGVVPSPTTASANSGWVAPPGTTGASGSDQNRNNASAQWNR